MRLTSLRALAVVALTTTLGGLGFTGQAGANCGDADSLGALVGQVPGNSGGTVLGTPCDGEIPPRSIVHSKTPVTRAGPWQIKESTASGTYNTTPENFGTTKVNATSDLSFRVRDMMYPLPDGSVGTQLIPTKDHGKIKLPDGKRVDGYAVADAFLRKQLGLSEDDPLYVLAGFTHFEGSEGGYKELGGPMVKTEMGQTHLAAYMGLGETTNSPDDYHGSQWGNQGYPANLYTVSVDMDADGDVDADDHRLLGKNAHNTLGILGHGVKFPGDYKNDPLTHAKSLATSLEFYKAWLEDPDEAMFQVTKNKLYCAELQTIALNLALNVQHNEDAFVELFGAEGKDLFKLAQERYEERATGRPTGTKFPNLFETEFEPLYKRTPGFTVEPGKAVIEMASAKEVGNALAWKPQTTADILRNFVETYASLPEVGGLVSNSVINSFKDLIQQRTGIPTAEYKAMAMPVMSKIMIAEALSQPFAGDATAFGEYVKKSTGGLYVALGGNIQDLMSGNPDPKIYGDVEQIMAPVQANAADILKCAGATGMSKTAAHGWMRNAIAADVAEAQGAEVRSSGAATWFSAPAVPHKIVMGQWDSHPSVTLSGVGTAVDVSELDFKPGQSFTYDDGIAADEEGTLLLPKPGANTSGPPMTEDETTGNDSIRSVRGQRAPNNNLASGRVMQGWIPDRSDKDFFRIEVPAGSTITIEMQPPAGTDFDIQLFDSDGDSVADLTMGGDGELETIEYTATGRRKVFYLKVLPYDGASSTDPYTVEASW